MKKVVIGLVVAVAIGLIALPFAVAGPGGRGGGFGGPGYGGYMMGPGYGPNYGGYGPQASQLTPEQTQKLDQLRQKYWEETKGLRADLFAKQQEIKGLYLQANPDQKAIDKLQKEAFTLQQKLQEKDFAFRQEMDKVAPGYGYGHGYGHRGGGCRY